MPFTIRTEVYVPETYAAADPLLSSGWVSLPARWADGVDIRRGSQSESNNTPATSTCAWSVKDNRDGTWTPTNPLSAYRDRFGLGSPVRVTVDRVIDSFARTVASSWGSTPSTSPTGALAWSQFGASSAASDWSVSSGAGRHSIDAANEDRYSYLAGTSLRNAEVCFDFNVPIIPTGGSVRISALLRGSTPGGTPTAIQARLTCAPIGNDTLDLVSAGGSIVGATAVALISGTTGRLRAQVEEQTVRIKVWDPAVAGEPRDWDLVESDLELTAGAPTAGWVGIRSVVSTGNTNTKPIVFAYDNFTASIPRYAGIISDPEQDAGGHPNDTRLRIDAAGIIQSQRLRKSPAVSPLRRAILKADTAPVAYWPLEDTNGATRMASALTVGRPMTFAGGPANTIDLASDDTIRGSLALPTFEGPAGGYFVATIPRTTDPGEFLAYAVLHAPVGGAPVANQILSMRMFGGFKPLGQFLIELQPSGEMRLRVRDWLGVDVLVSSLTTTFGVNDNPCLFGVLAVQDGADVDWTLFRYVAGNTTPETLSGTMVGQRFGSVVGVSVGLGGSLGGSAIGHVTVVHDGATTALTDDIVLALDGHSGEPAGERLARITREEWRSFSYVGDLTNTTPMGPQPAKPINDLIDECVEVDMGLMAEAIGGELTYVCRTALYHQANFVALDYGRGGAANELSSPFKVSGNDQMIMNDLTLKRAGGGEYRAALETGPRSIEDLGNRDESAEINVETDTQLEYQAWWRVALGTATALRVPSLTVKLDRLSTRVHELAAITVGRRIKLSNPPPWASPEILGAPRELIVIGLSEHIDQSEWSIQLVCVPGELFNVPLVGTVANGGTKADSDDSYLAAFAASGAASLSVASTWLWTTSGGQMPIQLDIGGVAVTVTAISGASSPQTFTVTGVTRNLYQNEPVRLRNRPRYGY